MGYPLAVETLRVGELECVFPVQGRKANSQVDGLRNRVNLPSRPL